MKNNFFVIAARRQLHACNSRVAIFMKQEKLLAISAFSRP